MKHKTFQIGTISDDTTKPRDILESLYYAAKHFVQDPNLAANLAGYLGECNENETSYSDILDGAVELCDVYLPPYCYMGMHSGDGADFGVFVDIDLVQQMVADEEVITVSDLGELPEDFQGEVLQVSDHHNWTLYEIQNTGITEIWGLV